MAHLDGNQLLPDSISLSLLNPSQKNAYVQNLFRPPPPFTAASSCSGLARQASGRILVTPPELRTYLVNCVHVAFATPRLFQTKLATKIHSPLRCSKRTVQLLKAAPYYHLLFSSSFHSLLRELFSVPSRYYSLSVLANI